MSYLNTLLFGIYPYIAVAVCLVGSWIRFDREQYTWKAGSSQMLRTKNMRMGSNLFHIGILGVLGGHFVGLLTPESIVELVVTPHQHQLLAMIAGGFFGFLTLIGLSMLIQRRMSDPRIRHTSNTSDIILLFILMTQLLLGLSTLVVSAAHLNGEEMEKLIGWAQYFVTFQPLKAANSLYTVNILYKLHILLGMTLFLIFPFTRLVHMISAPIWYLGRRYQIVRQRG